MNVDVRDLVGQIKVKDPVTIGGLVSLVVATVLFAVTARSLVVSVGQRLEMQAGRDALGDAVARAQQARGTRPQELHQEIAGVEQRLADALRDLPTAAQANDEMARYYEYADELGVQLVRVQVVAVESEEQEQAVYRRQGYVLDVQGEVPNLMRFLARVGTGPYVAFSIDGVTIRSDGVPLASADLTVFTSELGPGARPRPVKTLPASVPRPTPDATEEGDLLRPESQMIVAMADRDWANAVSYGRSILAQSPGRPGIVQALYQSHLSWAHELLAVGRSVEARQQFEAALEVIPEGKEALEGLRQLDATE